MTQRRDIPGAPLVAALNGRTPSRRPVWFMRQAGRSLPEYREIRANVGMLESCFNPELLAEITLQPVRRHDVDAAILFSDIVVPLKAVGLDIDIVAGRGPVVAKPIETAEDIANLPVLDVDGVPEVQAGIAQILGELTDTQSLIGFAGAPFTLASYLIEGGPSKNHEKTKAMMLGAPELWHQLMTRLTPTIIAFLQAQINAGVDAIQLFDSWAGYLTRRDYRKYVLPYSSEIMAAVEGQVPRLHFGVGTGELLGSMAEAGTECVGVDWRVPLDVAAGRINSELAVADPTGDRSQHIRVLQGNLDPAVFFAGQDVVNAEVARICKEADRCLARETIRGHIFNLGHGVLPTTDPDVITRTVEEVHKL